MKTLDDKTLERLAEAICGGGEGLGDVPGVYRTGHQLASFIHNATGLTEEFSGSRKWWVLDQLRDLNRQEYGAERDPIPWMLQCIVLRLVDEREYRPDGMEELPSVLAYLNNVLFPEGLELRWSDEDAEYDLVVIPEDEFKDRRRQTLSAAAGSAHGEPHATLFDDVVSHPLIQKSSRRLFIDEHYPQAIFEAFKAVNNHVKRKSSRSDLDGTDMMAKVFRKDAPILRISRLSGQSADDEQEGFKFLFMGAMLGIRNPKGHETVEQLDPLRALQYLAFACLLCAVVDQSEMEES